MATKTEDITTKLTGLLEELRGGISINSVSHDYDPRTLMRWVRLEGGRDYNPLTDGYMVKKKMTYSSGDK